MKARGMGRVYQRGTRWWIQYSYRGRVYRETCHKECGENATQKDAVKLLRRRLGEIAEGRFVADADKVTFEQLAELILGNYRRNVQQVEGRMAEVGVHDHRWLSGAGAVEMEPVATDVDEPAWRRIAALARRQPHAPSCASTG